MPGWLAEAGIDYLHLSELAGRRRAHDIDPAINGGWQNQSFHNYADHTLTPEFAAGLARLEALARERRTVIVCGEPDAALPPAPHLQRPGGSRWHVEHLMTEQAPRPHTLGQWGATPSVGAHGVVTYPLGAPSPIGRQVSVHSSVRSDEWTET